MMKKRVIIGLTALCVTLMTGCAGGDSAATPRNEESAITENNNTAGTPTEEIPAEEEPVTDNNDSFVEDGTADGTDIGKGASDNQTVDDNGSTTTIEEAKKIALQKAGLQEKDVTWNKEKMDRDDGRTVYELEFVSGTMEYDFEIDAESGDILEYDQESVYD